MGDKGGKKDKEKNKQQQLTKHKQGSRRSTRTTRRGSPQQDPRKGDWWARGAPPAGC